MKNTLTEKIIEEIKRRGAPPNPRWHFLLKSYMLWGIACLSTLIGGFGVATIIFLLTDYDKNLGKYLTESVFVDFLEFIPYFWISTIIVIVGITKYTIRHTTFGYRYSTIRIISIVLMGNLIIGIGLYYLGIGERVQNYLVRSSPYYDALTYTSKDAWSHPEKGLLGGKITAIINPEEIELTDFQGKKWRVDVDEVDDQDQLVLVKEGLEVKVIGVEKPNSLFGAEEIFPWLD